MGVLCVCFLLFWCGFFCYLFVVVVVFWGGHFCVCVKIQVVELCLQ